jgi:phage I-like protein
MRQEDAAFSISLESVLFSAATAETTRIPLCMVGTFYKGKQKFRVTLSDVEHMATEFKQRGECVMDYEHASEFPGVAQGQPIPAAGWIVGVDSKPDSDGVVWGSVKLTSRARDLIEANEYKYVSPVLRWGARVNGKPVEGMTIASAAFDQYSCFK